MCVYSRERGGILESSCRRSSVVREFDQGHYPAGVTAEMGVESQGRSFQTGQGPTYAEEWRHHKSR